MHSLPDGYDTVIDDEASNISAGEKQLITIARAFLADPSLLILDEATSSVDTRTEVLVQQAMVGAARRPHQLRHRAPALHDPRRRPDPGDGGRRASSSRARTTSCSPRTAPTHALYDAQFAAAQSEIRQPVDHRAGVHQDGPVTTTRDAGDAPPEADAVPAAPPAPSRSPWPLRVAALAGLVAVVCGLALPFAPVVVSTPTVTWPRDPARVESTLLPLTAYRPLGLDVRFGCDAVRRAAAVPDTGDGRGAGTVLATALPGSGQAGAALVVSAAADRVQVRVRDTLAVDEPVPPGACTYRLTGTDAGLPVDVRGPPTRWAASTPPSRSSACRATPMRWRAPARRRSS